MLKRDIKDLPFDEILPAILSLQEKEEEDFLAVHKTAIKRKQDAKIASLTIALERHGNYEEGSDGYEEDAREELNFIDTDTLELDEEDKQICFKTARDEVVAEFIRSHNLAINHAWVLPQMITYFGDNWIVVRNEAGLIDGFATAKKSNKGNAFGTGLYFVAMSPRKDLGAWPKGSTTWYALSDYNHYVPLILKGIKQVQGINYSDWDRDSLFWVVDEELRIAMLSTPPIMTKEEKLELRNHGLKIASGTMAGKLRSPKSTFTLSHLDSYTKFDLSNLNKLSIAMLAQIGGANPANINKRYQVLDPYNWDEAPDPLVDGDVVAKGIWTPKTSVSSKKRVGVTGSAYAW